MWYVVIGNIRRGAAEVLKMFYASSILYIYIYVYIQKRRASKEMDRKFHVFFRQLLGHALHGYRTATGLTGKLIENDIMLLDSLLDKS